MISAIMGFLSKPLTTVLERLIPNKTKQKEFEHEFKMEVLNEASFKGKAFAKRLIAEIQHPNWLRDSVRPVITYCAWALYAYIKITVVYVASKVYLPLMFSMLEGSATDVYARLETIKTLLQEFRDTVFTEFDFYLLLTILTFWFGGKLIERFTNQVTGQGGIKALILGK